MYLYTTFSPTCIYVLISGLVDEYSDAIDLERRNKKEPKSVVEDTSVYTLDNAMKDMTVSELKSNNKHENQGTNSSDKTEAFSDAKADNGNDSSSDKVERCANETSKQTCTDGIETVANRNVERSQDKIHVKDKPSKPEATQRKGSDTKSKTDYLMQLLEKRKNLLAKMADIQPVRCAREESVGKATESVINDNNDNARSKQGTVNNTERSLSQEVEIQENVHNSKDIAKKVVEIESSTGERVGIETESEIELKADYVLLESEKVHVKDDGKKGNSGSHKSDATEKPCQQMSSKGQTNKESTKGKVKQLLVFQSICEGVKHWMTKESREYLKRKTEVEAVRGPEVTAKTEFDKKYEALVAKVDAQETDFDKLIGKFEDIKVVVGSCIINNRIPLFDNFILS